ncbi:hypothetical protein LOTGIDRAFT_132122, partial [Lottia gigantea]
LSTKKYWKEFYTKSELNQNEQFDWFLDAQTVCEQLDNVLDSNDKEPLRILDIGCGASSIPSTLCSYSHRPLDLHCVDFIQSALCQQQSWLSRVKFKNPQTLTHFIVADVCRLPYKDTLFDVIIDKGTMDALLKDRNSGNVNGRTMVFELARVSQDNGTILQISDEDPDIRLPLLESWSVSGAMVSVKWTSTVLKSFGSIEYFAFHGIVSRRPDINK